MDLVQSTIAQHLRQGFSQKSLAQALHVNEITLHKVYKGLRPAPDKLLKALGLKRHIIYTIEVESTHLVLDSPLRPQKRVRMPKFPTRAQMIPKMPREVAQQIDRVIAERLFSAPALTTERILVAVKFKLNPKQSWAAFNAPGTVQFCESLDDSLDTRWLAYCQGAGTAPTEVKRDERVFVGIGDGAAVPLNPVNRGIDHRKPLAFGEKPQFKPIIQPEAPQMTND